MLILGLVASGRNREKTANEFLISMAYRLGSISRMIVFLNRKRYGFRLETRVRTTKLHAGIRRVQEEGSEPWRFGIRITALAAYGGQTLGRELRKRRAFSFYSSTSCCIGPLMTSPRDGPGT